MRHSELINSPPVCFGYAGIRSRTWASSSTGGSPILWLICPRGKPHSFCSEYIRSTSTTQVTPRHNAPQSHPCTMIDEATELSRVLSLPIPQVNPDPFFFLFPFAFSFNRLESHSREGKGTTQDLWPYRGASHLLAILHWARAEKARVPVPSPRRG